MCSESLPRMKYLEEVVIVNTIGFTQDEEERMMNAAFEVKNLKRFEFVSNILQNQSWQKFGSFLKKSGNSMEKFKLEIGAI